ncbi:uncharacterized protein F5891DRAFT_1193609 [Suillus fuscotomentosus]|uniref:Uncharacterized protein n=1 Tax=Suillus fuscotomentosus TaxID=1912939 RepID=A0AAD4HHS7_9AGAM|nr:uncharacterized protein F5891DRAFT_1193609 [Suillus fuscotomentosus]KAG1895979.1 hypothetical protein F5891DRAFT_1193609 [Suillus fuscotomentosus]
MSATVYIDTIQKGDSVGLKPLALSVLFHGSVPHVFQTPTQIPLEITINVPSEFAGYVVPILDAAPLVISSPQPRLRMPSFFPLPSDFDPFTARRWVTLLYKLESWLVHIVVDTCAPEWTWGRDAFWMAFLAAYPDFPHGSWPVWNSRISLEGAFIESWTLTKDPEDLPALITDHDTIRAVIWTDFQRLATECFPYSLVAEL